MATFQGPLAVLFPLLLLIVHFSTPAEADGRGILGFGKWLYKPPCAHACRAVIEDSIVICDPQVPVSANAPPTNHHTHGRHNSPRELMTEACLLGDGAFLRTLALCIFQHCPLEGLRISMVEEYWEGHVLTGTVGNWDLHPNMSYQDALLYALKDMERVGKSNMPHAQPGVPLNTTSLVREQDWIPRYNARNYVERNERDHGRNGQVQLSFTPCFSCLLQSMPAV